MKPQILVHVCCAPDALYVVTLLQENYEIIGYFYNPNIHPLQEYTLRLKETEKVAYLLRFRLLVGEYEDEKWFRLTDKFKHEPEKGTRCDICYALRLEKTAQKAVEEEINIFTTVMSLSPWKKADVLNRIGKMLARKYRINFLEANFKKKDGFKKSVEMSKQQGLYRQNFCGCIHSRRSFEKPG